MANSNLKDIKLMQTTKTNIENIVSNFSTLDGAIDDLNTAVANKVSNVKIGSSTIVDSDKVANIAVEGTYNASSNKIATETTVSGAVSTAVSGLSGSAGIASKTNDIVTLKAGVTEANGVISNSTGSDITLGSAAVKTALTGDTISGDSTSLPNATQVRAFVNSSIATETATFRGTSAEGLTEEQFLAWANSLTKTKNDYVFWNTSDAAGNKIFKRYKYDGSAWVYEYTLNNSSFTATQWATINSGMSSSDKTKLDGIEAGAQVNVQADWNASTAATGAIANKPNLATVATSGNYNDLSNKPTIPTIPDIEIAAATGSGNAITGITASGHTITPNKGATFLTSHQDISGKEDKTNKVTTITSSSTDTQYPSAKCVFDAISAVSGGSIYDITSSGWADDSTYTGYKSFSVTVAANSYPVSCYMLNATTSNYEQVMVLLTKSSTTVKVVAEAAFTGKLLVI